MNLSRPPRKVTQSLRREIINNLSQSPRGVTQSLRREITYHNGPGWSCRSWPNISTSIYFPPSAVAVKLKTNASGVWLRPLKGQPIHRCKPLLPRNLDKRWKAFRRVCYNRGSTFWAKHVLAFFIISTPCWCYPNQSCSQIRPYAKPAVYE